MIVCGLALFSLGVNAQDVDFGIKAGVNFASINDISGNPESRTGFVFGAFAGFKLGDKIGLQGDVLYSQQGSKVDLGEINLDYINVPVVLKYYVTENLNIHAGPQFGFVAKDDFKSDIGDIETSLEAETFDLSGVVGVGFDLPVGLYIDGRYNFGLSKIFGGESTTVGDETVSTSSQGSNAVVTLSVGYSFL